MLLLSSSQGATHIHTHTHTKKAKRITTKRPLQRPPKRGRKAQSSSLVCQDGEKAKEEEKPKARLSFVKTVRRQKKQRTKKTTKGKQQRRSIKHFFACFHNPACLRLSSFPCLDLLPPSPFAVVRLALPPFLPPFVCRLAELIHHHHNDALTLF